MWTCFFSLSLLVPSKSWAYINSLPFSLALGISALGCLCISTIISNNKVLYFPHYLFWFSTGMLVCYKSTALELLIIAEYCIRKFSNILEALVDFIFLQSGFTFASGEITRLGKVYVGQLKI